MHDLGLKVAEQFVSNLFGAREGAVAVGVVGLEEHIVDTDLVEQLHACRVLEEAAVDLAVVVVRRRLGQTLLALRPHVRLVVVVGAFEVVGDPADLAFRVHQLQVRVAHEHPREEEVDHRGGRVRRDHGGGDDGRAVVGRTNGARARADVHRDDGAGLLTGLEEGIPMP